MKVHELFRIMNYDTKVLVVTGDNTLGYGGILDVMPFGVYRPIRNMDVVSISHLSDCIKVDVQAE